MECERDMYKKSGAKFNLYARMHEQCRDLISRKFLARAECSQRGEEQIPLRADFIKTLLFRFDFPRE